MNPNHVFNKDHLFERIWGLDAMGDVSTVTVHIRKIREKIETDPSIRNLSKRYGERAIALNSTNKKRMGS